MVSLRVALIFLFISSFIATAARSDSAQPQTDKTQMLNDVRSNALTYTARLPDFICMQVTKRDSRRANTRLTTDSGVMSPYYEASDVIVEKLTFFGQKENYEVVSINNLKTSVTHEQLTGASSAGEFGSALRAIFDPQSGTEFKWQRMSSLRGQRTFVLDYKVPKEAGIPVTDRKVGKEVKVAYEGTLYIEANSNQVLRFTTRFILPARFPIQKAYRTVDFQWTNVAGIRYMLPLHSELSMESYENSFINKIEFKDYRKFVAESTIRFGGLDSPRAEGIEQAAIPSASNVAAESAATTSKVAASEVAVAPESVTAPEPVQEVGRSVENEARKVEVPDIAAREHLATPSPSTAVAAAEPNGAEAGALRLDANLVLVPVVVRDKNGNAITNLSRENFALFDGKRQQEISSFSVETGRMGSAEGNPPLAGISGNDGSMAMDNSKRYVVFLFDDLHFKVEDLVRAREATRRQIAEMPAADHVAVISTSGLVTTSMNASKRELDDSLLKLQAQPLGKPNDQRCPEVTYFMAEDVLTKGEKSAAFDAAAKEAYLCLKLNPEQAWMATNVARGAVRTSQELGERVSRNALLQLRDVIRWLSKAPGRREVILISPGFFLNQSAFAESFKIVDEAIRSQVVVSALDGRGVYDLSSVEDIEQKATDPDISATKFSFAKSEAIAVSDTMAAIAEGTGGKFVHNTNDLYGGLQKLATPPEYIYLLGFMPKQLKHDGSFHQLTVKVDKKETLAVQARRGYFATK